jgi:hypothetical protein
VSRIEPYGLDRNIRSSLRRNFLISECEDVVSGGEIYLLRPAPLKEDEWRQAYFAVPFDYARAFVNCTESTLASIYMIDCVPGVNYKNLSISANVYTPDTSFMQSPYHTNWQNPYLEGSKIPLYAKKRADLYASMRRAAYESNWPEICRRLNDKLHGVRPDMEDKSTDAYYNALIYYFFTQESEDAPHPQNYLPF